MIYLYRQFLIDPPKAIIQIGDRDYFENLIPKYKRAQGLRYDPHITIIRSFEEAALSQIWRFNDTTMLCHYDPFVYEDDERYFLKAWCDEACLIRRLAGLSIYRNGFDCFHLTLGKKNVSPKNSR